MTQTVGLRDAVMGILRVPSASCEAFCAACSTTTTEGWPTHWHFRAGLPALGFAIVALVAWVMNVGNFVEAAILGILATFQGKILTSLLEVSMTFALPITLTFLLVSTDFSTCFILLCFLAVQLAYLRWSINAKLARVYLARIAAIRGGLSSLEPEEELDDEDDDDDPDPE